MLLHTWPVKQHPFRSNTPLIFRLPLLLSRTCGWCQLFLDNINKDNKQRCVKNFNGRQPSSSSINQQGWLTRVWWAVPQAQEFWRTEEAEEHFWFVSPLVICWLWWSSMRYKKKRRKKVSFSSEYSSVFPSPPLFYHSRPFPHAVTERSLQLYWYTSLAQFHEREIIYQWKETSLPFSDTIPPPTPLKTFLFYHRKRKWMSANLCVFEVGRMKASSSAWAQQQVGWGVGVCLYLSGKSTPRTRWAWARTCAYLLI